ncbi:beta-N-acetylhexosaminidase [Halosimplex marinum]|uniref:beta-N-acetylhexosaminidase n=1 Tax=Halosimplex marinum TaxID=3396620 RepID=UPI003F558BAB
MTRQSEADERTAGADNQTTGTDERTAEDREQPGIDVDVADLTLAEKVGQLFHVGFHGTEPTEDIRELVADYGVGGVIYFSRNVETPEQTAALSAALQEQAREATGVPLAISTDQEGGIVSRVPFGTVPPGQMALGATGDADLAREFGSAIAGQLRAVGINTNFAPVLDVNNNPDNPVIGVRSFGSDPDLVGELGSAVAAGLQGGGVAACGKHFPGHGDTAVDPHEAMPTVGHDRERLDAVELAPFRAAVDAGIDAIMTAHVNFPAVEPDPDVPATLSERVLTGLLREELGYDGVVVTDCMEMNAIADGVGTVDGAVQTIRAGADVVLVSHTADRQRAAIEAVVEAVRDGTIPEERIDESVRRVLRLKAQRFAGADAPSVEAAGEALTATAERVARDAVTLVSDGADLVPLPDDRDVFVWDFPAGRGSAAEDGGVDIAPLVDALESRGRTVRRHTFADEGRDADDLPAVDADEVVLACTFDAATNARQARVVRAALDAGHPVAVVALRNPYDRRAIPEAQTFLTTYDYSPAMLAGAADVLTGRHEARGRLPVTLD